MSNDVNSNADKKTTPSETKPLIIKCASLILGAALLIYSFSSCLGKISDTNKSIAESLGKPQSNPVSDSADAADAFADDFSSADSTDTPADEDEFSEQTDSEQDYTADTTSSDEGTTSAAKENKAQEKGDAKKESALKKPETKEEILNYFNTAINKVKPNAKSITYTKDESYQAGSIDLAALGAFESIVDKLIGSFMGPNEEKIGLTLKTTDEKNALYPVEGEKWASKLTMADIKDASCTEKNGIYTITIKLLDDELSENPANGSGHHPKAFSVVKAGDINKNAGAAKSLLTGLKTGYKNGTIICNIDAKTGNVLSSAYDYVWILHVDSFGGVDAPFGGRQSFDIKW